MKCVHLIYFLFFQVLSVFTGESKGLQERSDASANSFHQEVLNRPPTIAIVILVRNKAHTLPTFFSCLEKLRYPTDRISLWVRTDHNADHSSQLLKQWINAMSGHYHSIDVTYDKRKHEDDTAFEGETGPTHWPNSRITHVLKLRQKGLEYARKIWADFVLYVDVDNFLVNPDILHDLITQRRTIVGPMLNSTVDYYSNFWCAMTEKGFYARTEDYYPILYWRKLGSFPVAMLHSTFLIDLRRDESTKIQFYPPPPGYTGPYDDIIIFAIACQYAGVPMHVLNGKLYGYMLSPLDEMQTIETEVERMQHLRLECMLEDNRELPEPSSHIEVDLPPKDKAGFSQIYMINLLRRPERRERMLKSLEELRLQAKIFDAVDGKQLNDTYLFNLGVEMLPEYRDPYSGRSMTLGEIGCFLSHYFIWEEIVKEGYETVLVLEDDVRFDRGFRRRLDSVMDEVKRSQVGAELIYIGRKALKYKEESFLEESDQLVWPHYTYWTLAYIITQSGAKKLLDQKPLGKMVPVDEYLPIMFDKHTMDEWKLAFEPRNLVSLSVYPLLVYPMKYTGEPGYITDTEDSEVTLQNADPPEVREFTPQGPEIVKEEL
ncbi:unnamed protein product [Owenia fusiformis]|uniref:Glycosyl transferase family 25 domain-containing protein n=1 Tax=Owenia fusiformis TaxID=6347 RepID=A0A8J1UFF3_OWEFU|nr:unnamed protein product [Owenia fusiformis]